MMATTHKKRTCFLKLIIVMVAAVSATSCQFAGQFLPEKGSDSPPVQEPSTAVSPDESPRTQGSQDLPPTWTPSVQQRDESTVAPGEVAPDSTQQAGYVVQAGDTLAEIASRFNVSIDELARVNGIEDFDHIEVGQVLVIPGS